MNKISSIILLIVCVGSMHATTPAKGIFSVAANKTVQFANANETALVQWVTANEWREANKAAEGHNGWYVLDSEQWTYLMITRDGEGMSKNNLGTVNGKKGLIILPDGWVQPAGIPEFQDVSKGEYYNKNIYTAAQWALMEASGAVFLPCEGYSEDGSSIINPTDHGAYWSSDQYSAENGNSIHFNNGEIHDFNDYASKTLYYSILLVKDVPTPTMLDEEHESAAYATDWEAAKGKDFAYVHRTLKKDSTLYTLCLPFDVPNIDASPLAGAEVFEFEGGTVSGSDGNERLHLHLSRLVGKRLTQGVPYILRWAKTNPVQTLSYLYFYDVENWDDDTNTATDPGDETIQFHGVYPRAHIPGYTSSSAPHYNFFIGANNTLYWPDDEHYSTSNMKGFRAYFHVTPPSGGPSSVSKYRNMPVEWNIDGALGATTEIQTTSSDLKPQTTKVLRDGQVVIIRNGQCYDITGKRL